MQRSTSKSQPGLSGLDGMAAGAFASPFILFLLSAVAPDNDGQDGWIYALLASLAFAGATAAVGSVYAARKAVLVGFGTGLAVGALACLGLLGLIGASLGS